MNERIKELAREAGFYANPDVEKFERFAELVRRQEREAWSVEKFHLENDLEKTQDLLNECLVRENFSAIRGRTK